jgi:excisionase family DNA binding protein
MHATRSPELLRIPEAAERLNVSRASVYRWIDEGRLPAIQLGGRGAPIRVRAAELDEWIDNRRRSNVSDDGSRQGQLRADATPAERRVPGPAPAVEARQPAGGER